MKLLKTAVVLCSLLLGYNAGLRAQGTPLVPPNIPFYDSSTGVTLPCVGCMLWSYAAGTVTPLATYTDHTLATTNTDPVVMDSAGYNSAGSGSTGIWLGLACYKFELQNSSAVTLWTIDYVCSTSFGSGGGGGGSLTPPVTISGSTTSPTVTITQTGSGNALLVNGAAIFGTTESIAILLSQTLGGPHDWFFQVQSPNILGFYDSSNFQRMSLNANQIPPYGVFLRTPSVIMQPTVGTQSSLQVLSAIGGQSAPIFEVVDSFSGSTYFGVGSTGDLTGTHGQNIGAADSPSFASVTSAGNITALNFVATVMPLSCSGQPSGALWNNSGVANVCP